MLDFVAYSTLSKINRLELSFSESTLKYQKLILKNYPRCFECSKYCKHEKLEAGGKPSTWFPPEWLVEHIFNKISHFINDVTPLTKLLENWCCYTKGYQLSPADGGCAQFSEPVRLHQGVSAVTSWRRAYQIFNFITINKFNVERIIFRK